MSQHYNKVLSVVDCSIGRHCTRVQIFFSSVLRTSTTCNKYKVKGFPLFLEN